MERGKQCCVFTSAECNTDAHSRMWRRDDEISVACQGIWAVVDPYGPSLTSTDFFQLVLDDQKDKQIPECKGPPEAKFILESLEDMFKLLEVDEQKLPMTVPDG